MSRTFVLTVALLAAQSLIGGSSSAIVGQVVDAISHQPLADAIVTLGDESVRSGSDGWFAIMGSGERLGVRAYGHGRVWVPIGPPAAGGGRIALAPLMPRALYLSAYGVASNRLWNAALELARTTEINALVVDLKSEHGIVAYRSAVPLALEIGAEQPRLIPNLKGLVDSLHAQDLYAIARIVVFRDSVLATARPDLAVKTAPGTVWRDSEGMAWTDPFRQEVWSYNVGIAIEAARAGFDEIQFDYARFPDAPGLVFAEASTQASRVAAITGFLTLARRKLRPYNVFVGADIFGYVCWNMDDTGIGQTLQSVLPQVDYVSPMLYPSAFQYGIPGIRNAVAQPYEIVFRSLQRALSRAVVPPDRFRPWLQAFRDYAFDRRRFGAAEIRAQIQAAQDAGADGFMLWNPRNVYTSAGLEPKNAAPGN